MKMNPFYYILISLVALCSHGNQAFQETKNLREDTILFPKVRHVSETRHVSAKHMKPISLEMPNDKPEQWSGEELDVSNEDKTYIQPSNFVRVDSASENKFIEREPSMELEKISSNISAFLDQVNPVAEHAQTVEIDEDKDRLKLNGDDNTGSNLWIYSNVVCILLVVGLSIFLIYYPSNDSSCKNSESSASSSSSSSTTSSSAA